MVLWFGLNDHRTGDEPARTGECCAGQDGVCQRRRAEIASREIRSCEVGSVEVTCLEIGMCQRCADERSLERFHSHETSRTQICLIENSTPQHLLRKDRIRETSTMEDGVGSVAGVEVRRFEIYLGEVSPGDPTVAQVRTPQVGSSEVELMPYRTSDSPERYSRIAADVSSADGQHRGGHPSRIPDNAIT